MRVYIGSFQDANQVCVWVIQLLNHKQIYKDHEKNICVAELKSPFNPALTKLYPGGSDSSCSGDSQLFTQFQHFILTLTSLLSSWLRNEFFTFSLFRLANNLRVLLWGLPY